MLPDYFIFRFFLMLVIYCYVSKFKHLSIIFIIILLLIIDVLDSEYIRIKTKNIFHKFDKTYKLYDKINDSLSYILILPIIYKLGPYEIFILLTPTTFYRSYAVCDYAKKENSDIFIQIPDLFKEILLIEYIANNYKIVQDNKSNILVLTTFLKAGFEYVHHKLNKYNNP